MNLSEFIRRNNIQSIEGDEFAHSPEFFQIREFEQTCHTIRGVPFLEPETYQVREFDVTLKGSVQENWDRHEKKNKRQFLLDRTFHYPGSPEGLESIEDAVPAGQSVDEALAALEADRDRFEFFRRYDLIDAGRYWLNRDLKRCLVVDGQVVVMGSGVRGL
jgi:hypothetical protein